MGSDVLNDFPGDLQGRARLLLKLKLYVSQTFKWVNKAHEITYCFPVQLRSKYVQFLFFNELSGRIPIP